jgi:hypothetical protein
MPKFTRKVLLSTFQGVTPMTSLNLETGAGGSFDAWCLETISYPWIKIITTTAIRFDLPIARSQSCFWTHLNRPRVQGNSQDPNGSWHRGRS